MRIRKDASKLAFVGICIALLAGCQMPNKDPLADFHELPGGSFENTGAIIEEPAVFQIFGGQSFVTPFSIDCTHLSAASDGWQAALAAGAHKVLITLPGQRATYGGVLALCKIHKSATGASSRSYQLVIPQGKIAEAQDGLISSVAEQVSVQRPAAVSFAQIMAAQPGQPVGQVITDDFAWMLWFTDRPSALGITFAVNNPAPAPKQHAPVQRITLTKGATYSVTSGVSVHAGPGSKEAVVTRLTAGDTVVATGEEKGGYWAVTTAGGESGWVSSKSLKPE